MKFLIEEETKALNFIGWLSHMSRIIILYMFGRDKFLMGTIPAASMDTAIQKKCGILKKNVCRHIGTIDFKFFLVYNTVFRFLKRSIGRQAHVIRREAKVSGCRAHLRLSTGLLSKCTKFQKNKERVLRLGGCLLSGAFILLGRRHFGGRHEFISKACDAFSRSVTNGFYLNPRIWGTQY